MGLSEGIDVIDKLGIDRVRRHEKSLFYRTREGLCTIGGVEIYTPEYEGPVLLFNLRKKSSEETARLLAERGICVRGGYHCAALGHKTMGTENGGAVRVSFGPFNGTSDVDALCDAIKHILK